MKKIKKGYKTGTEVNGKKKPPTTFDWGDVAKAQKYIKFKGKYIPLPKTHKGSHRLTKKGGKV
jgi:hypothetical protein